MTLHLWLLVSSTEMACDDHQNVPAEALCVASGADAYAQLPHEYEALHCNAGVCSNATQAGTPSEIGKCSVSFVLSFDCSATVDH